MASYDGVMDLPGVLTGNGDESIWTCKVTMAVVALVMAGVALPVGWSSLTRTRYLANLLRTFFGDDDKNVDGEITG